MKRWTIVAYSEEGLPRQECDIYAKYREDAMDKAWDLFPEYHEIGVYEVEEEE